MKPRLSQRFQFSLAYLLVAMVVLSILQSWLLAPRPVELPISQFLELLRADKIERVAITDREIRGVAKPEPLRTAPGGARDWLRELLTPSFQVRVLTVTRIPRIAAGRPPRRSAGHGEGAPGARGGGRGRRAVLHALRLGVRRDVRRRRRRARARPVRAGERQGAVHHLHRRARRDRQVAGGGDRVRRRPRRARADPEPAARGDGRLRLVQG